MKKFIVVATILLTIVSLSACSAINEDESKNTFNEDESKNNGLSQAQILSVKAEASEEMTTTQMDYNSAESTGMVQATNGVGETLETQKTFTFKIPSDWQKFDSKDLDNAYIIPTSAKGKSVVDIWTVPSIKKDKSDPIMGMNWMTSKEVVEAYFEQQGEDVQVFQKEISGHQFALATIDLPQNNQTVVTYAIINDDGNFSSSAILVNVIMFDKNSTKDKLEVLAKVEGVLAQLEIKKNK